VQLLGAAVAVYSVVQLVLHLRDGEYGSAFLSFAYVLVASYFAVESWRFHQRQVADQDVDQDAERPAPTEGPAPTD
jgi:hypothetical protein